MTTACSELIDYLVERKFAGTRQTYESWQQDRTQMFYMKKPLPHEAATYKSELENMSPQELKKILAEGLEEQAAKRRVAQELEDSTRFFSAPEANANFAHWSKVDLWTLDEATALSLGKAPEVVGYGSLVNRGLEDRSPFTRAYMNRRHLLTRAKEAGTLEFPVLPAAYVSWAEQRGVALPEDLISAVASAGYRIEERNTLLAERDSLLEVVQRLQMEAAKEKPLNPKERNSLQRMVLGMAKVNYGYDPTKERNSAVTRIARDLEGVELDVGDDTVRRRLKEANDEVSV